MIEVIKNVTEKQYEIGMRYTLKVNDMKICFTEKAIKELYNKISEAMKKLKE